VLDTAVEVQDPLSDIGNALQKSKSVEIDLQGISEDSAKTKGPENLAWPFIFVQLNSLDFYAAAVTAWVTGQH